MKNDARESIDGHDALSSEDDFNNLLDTFDLRKQSFKAEETPNDNIARRLFINDDTFANNELGDHSISNDIHFSHEEPRSPEPGRQSGTVVGVRHSCENLSEDYLQVRPGDEVKLLRKIGNLWIAELGAKIGYISEENLN
jgi:hypothetical protein